MSASAFTGMRRSAASALAGAQPAVRRIARQLLRVSPFRSVLNGIEVSAGSLPVYPRRDFRVSDAAEFLFHTADLTSAFAWRCRAAGQTFMMPVDPAFPRPAPRNDPWGPATYWDRAANRKIRQVYSAYLRRRRAGTFVDIGANWGNHTYVFAAAGYACVSFEPQSICCRFMERVADLNGFTRVSVVPEGVGAACKSGVPFYESEVEAFSSLDERHVASFHRPWAPRLIDCTTLDAYCGLHEVSPTFIKIDAEGLETDIVLGASSVLARCRPDLLIEISAPEAKQQVLWDALHALGYRCYSIVRSLGHRYPAFPFTRMAGVEAFLESARETPSETFEGDRDFVFLQPDSDVLAAAARPSH